MIHDEEFMKKILPKKTSAPDESFVHELYQKLELEMKPKTSTINFKFMNKFRIAFAGAAVVAVALLVYVNVRENQTVFLPGKQQITKINDHAFGSLGQLTGSSRNQSGGGSAPESADNKMAAPAPGMGGGGGDMIPINYKYVYKGDSFTVDADKMEVFERQKGFASSNLNGFLSRFNTGLFDIKKFSQAQIDYVHASENRDYGYALSIDFKEGTIMIDQNWERWPNPAASCADDVCFKNNQIKIEQVPTDETVITAANKFLDDYGIDRASYGTPAVQNMWRVEYSRVQDKSQAYIPDMVNVVYPIQVSGNELYDESGNKTGLSVSYSVRANRISNVSQLTEQKYQGSDYATEQDTSRLLKLAETGGYYSYMPMMAADGGSNAQTKELELGKPTTGYVRLWQYTNNQSHELFVPSLIFPVLNPPEGMATSVTVPLIKEILDSRAKDAPPVSPQILE